MVTTELREKTKLKLTVKCYSAQSLYHQSRKKEKKSTPFLNSSSLALFLVVLFLLLAAWPTLLLLPFEHGTGKKKKEGACRPLSIKLGR